MYVRELFRLLVILSVSCIGITECAHAQTPLRAAPTSRSARRETLSDKQYKQLADELRETYSKPSDQWPKPDIDTSVQPTFKELGTVPAVPAPQDNPVTKEKAELGKQLFFDPRLSASKAVACASCHDPDLAWTDGRQVSFGHERQAGHRNAPSVMGAAYNAFQFWDGRARTLELQAMMPIVDDREMHATREAVEKSIGSVSEYREKFKAAFGATEDPDDLVSMERIGMAIATFERTIVPGHSKFDRFLSGKEPKVLSDSAIRGLNLFRTTARCINCHNGPDFSDGQFHNIGLTYYGRENEDLGRYNITKKPEDVGRFKTPSLRNVSRTGPYMHNGFFTELEGVINLYNAGGPSPRPTEAQKDDPLFPKKDPILKPLGLNAQDREDLLAFLESLTDRREHVRPPPLPGLSEPTTRRATTKPASAD
jgi:cytochrome c peroxidase